MFGRNRSKKQTHNLNPANCWRKKKSWDSSQKFRACNTKYWCGLWLKNTRQNSDLEQIHGACTGGDSLSHRLWQVAVGGCFTYTRQSCGEIQVQACLLLKGFQWSKQLALWSTKGCKFPGCSHSLSLQSSRVKGMFALGAGYHLEIHTDTVVQPSLIQECRCCWGHHQQGFLQMTSSQPQPSCSPSSQPQPALLSASTQHWHKEITVVKISYMTAIWWAEIRPGSKTSHTELNYIWKTSQLCGWWH